MFRAQSSCRSRAVAQEGADAAAIQVIVEAWMRRRGSRDLLRLLKDLLHRRSESGVIKVAFNS